MREHARLFAAVIVAACGSSETQHWTADVASCALDDVDAACSAPAQPITATSTIATAPAIDADVTYAIASPSGKHAYVNFTPTTSGRHTIYFGTEDEMQVCDLTAVCASMTTCPALEVAAQYLMDEGVRYEIEVPTGATDFRLRVEAPEGAPPPPPPPPPSSARIVFAAALHGQAQPDLYTMNADGTGIVRLTQTSGAELFPRWSPTRDRIAFVRDMQLLIRDADGSDERLVAPNVGRQRYTPDGTPYDLTISHAAWSPDGTQLVYPHPLPPFLVEESPGQFVDNGYATTLHIVNADGTDDHAIPNLNATFNTPPQGTSYAPVWRSDDVIAFKLDDDCPDCAGGSSYGFIRPDGTDFFQQYNLLDGWPVQGIDLSSDESRWVYIDGGTWNYEGRGNLLVAPAMSTDETVLVSTPLWSPHWSPDDAQIAYITDDGIYVVRADGTGATRILAATAVRGLDW